MSFPRYPRYKDSGLEWLGEVPEHWEVRRARTIGAFTASGIDKKTVEGEVTVRMFNYLDVYRNSGGTLCYSDELMVTTAPSDKVTEHTVRSGDILLTPSSETADDIGHAARVLDVPTRVVYSYHVLRFRATEDADPSFLTYFFASQSIRSYFASICTGTTRQVLVRDDFKSAPFVLPSRAEQMQIAVFLDHETANIDALITEQQRLIELLKEKRQAVISHAVTRGLDPDAPMKPSGVEWLGDMPAHWQVLRGRMLGDLFGSEQVPEDAVVDEGDLPFIKVGMLSLDTFDVQDWTWFVDSAIAEKLKVRSHFIVFPKRGAAIFTNKVNIVERPSVIDPNLMGWHIGKHARPRFMAYVLKARKLQELADVSTIPQLNVKHIAPEQFPVPPIAEQQAIVEFLDMEDTRHRSLVNEAERAITLLQERRTALISAAVTGKIDVRGLTEVA